MRRRRWLLGGQRKCARGRALCVPVAVSAPFCYAGCLRREGPSEGLAATCCDLTSFDSGGDASVPSRRGKKAHVRDTSEGRPARKPAGRLVWDGTLGGALAEKEELLAGLPQNCKLC